ncbi:MAG TPA: methylated-DNA--[protein]-cysteine S-methyltransferase [Polyangiaceae bacterium]|nr:methylated-DNA--[protein]-cysteine S-methyltransferase [Polyangiaceae bacterium]
MTTTAPGFALFDTAIGRCGIAWGEGGISGVYLPEARLSALRRRLLARHPELRESEPPAAVQRAIDRVITLLRGEATDLGQIALDMSSVPAFHRRVYECARAIPPGKTLSYGEVAVRVGSPGAARAVGQALGRNPFAIVVPCHRVLAAGGKPGGFSANGGVDTKLELLRIEQAQRSLFDGDGKLDFDPELAARTLSAADAQLARLIARIGPCRLQLRTTPSVFAALAESIVYQQLNGKAAATIFARVRALFPRARGALTAAQVLSASEAELRGAGLSNAKYLALRDLAERCQSGSLPTLSQIQKLSDEAIIERLSEVRGVGRWTVEMLLMFRLGRPDVLPLDDYGVRKGFSIAFRTPALPSKTELELRARRWKPFRTVASWYLWRATDSL